MKRIISLLLISVLLLGLSAGATEAGTSANPLISLSYVNQKYIPQITTVIQNKVNTGWTSVVAPYKNNLLAKYSQVIEKLGLPAAAVKTQIGSKNPNLLKPSSGLAVKSLASGQTLTAKSGATLTLKSGSARLDLTALDMTTGGELTAGASLPANHEILVLTDGSLTATAPASIFTSGSVTLGASAPYQPKNTDLADALKAMGLFLGVNGDYQLGRKPTRLEALIMMLRFMGEEQEALSAASYKHPYTDVPYWAGDNANRYVGYAHAKGYTNGVSPTRFDPNGDATAAMYMTYILRALGYRSSSGGDFFWDKSLEYAKDKGFFSSGEISGIQNSSFYRDQLVYLSYYSLFAAPKGKDIPLIQDLVNRGVVDNTAAQNAISLVTRIR